MHDILGIQITNKRLAQQFLSSYTLRAPRRGWWWIDTIGIPHSEDIHVRYCQIKFQPCLTLHLSITDVNGALRWPLLTIHRYRYIHPPHLCPESFHTMMNFERTGGRKRTPAPALIKSKAYKPCEGRSSGSDWWELVTWSTGRWFWDQWSPLKNKHRC